MTDRTPTTDDVREKYATVLDPSAGWKRSPEWADDFDRWLAAHDVEVRERVARDIKAHRAKVKAAEAGVTVLQLRQDTMTALIRGLDIAADVARGVQP